MTDVELSPAEMRRADEERRRQAAKAREDVLEERSVARESYLREKARRIGYVP